MYWHTRCTYICIPCRFTSKYPGQCPHCRDTMRAMYDLKTPRKRDDRGWKKIELAVLIHNSGIHLCTWTCCVPLRRNRDLKDLTLSQFKARIRKQRTHRQGVVPQHYK